MTSFSRISDVSNFFIGTFLSAPAFLSASGITSIDRAFEYLLQGIVGIILMLLTKMAGKFIEKYIERIKTIPPVPAPPITAPPPPESLTLNNTIENGKEISKQSDGH